MAFKISGQYIKGTEAELCKELAIVHEIWAEPLWDAENPLAAGYVLQDIFMQALAEFYDTLLVA